MPRSIEEVSSYGHSLFFPRLTSHYTGSFCPRFPTPIDEDWSITSIGQPSDKGILPMGTADMELPEKLDARAELNDEPILSCRSFGNCSRLHGTPISLR